MLVCVLVPPLASCDDELLCDELIPSPAGAAVRSSSNSSRAISHTAHITAFGTEVLGT